MMVTKKVAFTTYLNRGKKTIPECSREAGNEKRLDGRWKMEEVRWKMEDGRG